MRTVLLDRAPGSRLGRHVVHDPRSREYALPTGAATSTVLHERHIPIFDQAAVGSCTACAALGMISSGPLWRRSDPGWGDRDADALYHKETVLDDAEIPGEWPPDDTGSAGLYSAKALQALGLIIGYRHGFTTRATIAALQQQPVSIGVGWLQSMFDTTRGGRIVVDSRSAVAGGHQVCLDGVDVAHSLVRVANSWGENWGDHGWGWLTFRELDWLLRRDGDALTVTRAA